MQTRNSLVHFNYSGITQKDKQGETNFKSIMISCTSSTSKYTFAFGKYIIKPEPIFSALLSILRKKSSWIHRTWCRSAGWNLNPKQICVFTFEQETQNEVIFISQLKNDNMKENIATTAALQHDLRPDKFLHRCCMLLSLSLGRDLFLDSFIQPAFTEHLLCIRQNRNICSLALASECLLDYTCLPLLLPSDTQGYIVFASFPLG